MGLDMYIYQIDKKNVKLNKDLLVDKLSKSHKLEEIVYWRKNPAIHNWMEKLYLERGGKEIFNGVYLYLSEDNLKQLKNDIQNFKLNYEATGFFFGKSISPLSQDFDEESHRDDIQLIEKIISCLKNNSNDVILYDSSW